MTDSPGGTDLTWTDWPAARRPHVAGAVLVLLGVAGYYGYWEFRNLIFGAIAVAFLVAALASFLLPTTYRLTPEGVEIRALLHGRRTPWSQLACFIQQPGLLLLSTDARPTERSVRRGILLRAPYNEADVVSYLSDHLPRWDGPEAEAGPSD